MTEVDLARDVEIYAKAIDVYPQDEYRPELGQKLNKAAHVILFGGVKPKKGDSVQ